MVPTAENLNEIFSDLTVRELVVKVVRSIREAAEEVKIFRESHNGCIRLTFVPLCWEADVWLGGLSEYDEFGKVIDVNEYEFVRKIHPGGSHTIQWVDPKDGHVEPVNCYAYSALKVAYLSRLCREGLTRATDSGREKGHFIEENGWSTHAGASVTTAYYGDIPLFRMYATVSGAESTEDAECSRAGIKGSHALITNTHEQLNCDIAEYYE